MGIYLDSKKPFSLYEGETKKPYFIDKSLIINELIPLVEQGNQHICITRPRRFGKTITANMIASFFGMAVDSKCIFEHLNISKESSAMKHLNQHHVISMTLNELPRNCASYIQYQDRIESRLIRDLKMLYSDLEIDENETVADLLGYIYEMKETKFIFVLDEWDFIFYQSFITEADKSAYVRFLSNLFKDKPYVSLVYMTGILPIAKYSSGSELNMFLEYTMAMEERFSEYFGFTESEVDALYARYQKNHTKWNVTREGLKEWYDGYHTFSGERMYNPRSIVVSLTNNNLGNYWTSSGPYDEIFYYIKNNIAEVQDAIALMVGGKAVPAKVQEYAATSMRLKTKDEIFSAMVVYGFLSYENGMVSIPNKELMGQFENMIRKEETLGYVHRLAKESERMLKATLNGDIETMANILSYAHNTETPLLDYNSEIELTSIVNLVYLSARDLYRIEREDKAGIGYADFIFYPKKNAKLPGIILELKVDSTPEYAIKQIKDRNYILRFQGKMSEETLYPENVLAVGISYDRNKKIHRCKVEKLK